MAYNFTYLGLVNRVLQDFNEVQLTSSNFSSATGFQAYVKDYVNDALLDIYLWNDVEWPFLWTQKTFTTTIGLGLYNYDASLAYVDWDTFNILRPSITVDSLTRSGTTVTATVSAGHQLIAGRNDYVIINGAVPTDYDGQWTPTIVSPTVFTYQVSTIPTTPATGSITMIPPYSNAYLQLKNYDEYLRDWRDADVNGAQQPAFSATLGPTQVFSPPRFIVRQPDNNFIISPYPDRIYTIGYNGRVNPASSQLSSSTDVPLVPSLFRQVIIDRASVYCLAFRDNDPQLSRNDNKFIDSCHRMRRVLIPQSEYITFKH